MGRPEANGGYGEEDVLAWFEGPVSGEAKGDAHGVAGEHFDFGVCAAAADVTVGKRRKADEPFDDPESDDGFQVCHLLEATQMDP